LIIEITIPILPCSVNRKNQRSKHGTVILSKEYRQSKKDIMAMLNKHKGELETFAAMFDRRYHYVKCNWKLYRKEEVYWTKKGFLSLTAGDTDNYKKLFKDCIFNYMDLNDGVVKCENIISLSSKADYMTCVLKLCDLTELRQIEMFS
jgi:Holliday junction resolvase RusA-like endonuclease